MLIVHSSFEASSQNATLEEQVARADVWAELLINVVPEHRLQDAFRAAFRKHDSPFPVNAYEIKTAWEEIDHEEAREREIQLAKDQRENPVKYCDAAWNHINIEGDIEVYLGVPPNGREVVVPCQRCRAHAFYQRYDEERNKFVNEQPEMKAILQKSTIDVIMEMLADAKKAPRERPKPTTTIGILIEARLAGGDHEILTNAIAHIRRG